jgi:hypothetical protein
MRMLLSASLAAAAAVAGCAPTGAAGPGDAVAAGETAARPCFYTSQVRNFRTERNESIYVRVRADEVYELRTFGACLDLDSAINIGIGPRYGGGSDRACVSDQVEIAIVHPTSAVRSPCYARIERRLTAEEVAALPDRSRP